MKMAGRRAPRRPWYWLAIVALSALAAVGAVIDNMHSRIEGNDSQFAAAEQLRVQRSEQRIDHFFGDAEQLARIGAQTTGSSLGDLSRSTWIVDQMFRARRSAEVYGIGVFYAPYAFASNAPLLSIYDRTGRTGGIVQVLFHGFAHSRAQDYTRAPWYRRAIQTPGETRWAGPYTDRGESYISTLRAFERGGRIRGAFRVDILTSRFKALLSTGLAPGDIAWVQSGVSGRWLLGTARLPADAAKTRIETTMHLRYTLAILHLSADAGVLRGANGRIKAISIALIVLIIGFATVAAIVLMQRWQREDETVALQAEQARLEHEVSVARRVEGELRHMAFTDALTGLPNRAAFLEWVRDLLGTGQSGSHAIFLADLDRFNLVNETIGHPAGDELIRTLAMRLWSGMPPDTLVARLGGDEFVIVAPAGGDASATAAAILALVGEPIIISGQTFKMQASLGVVPLESTYANAEDALRDADIAVYHAKAEGRARWAFFDVAMRARVASESALEADVRQAIEREEFVVHYQPLIRIASGEIASFEALVRWDRPGKGIISAADFVPFAEARGLMASIDAVTLRTVCSQSAAIAALFPGTSIAVNISAAELASSDLPEVVERLLSAHRLQSNQLTLEITETAMMTRADSVASTLERLRALGIALVLDDFGTGYSSLAYLQRLPIAGLKIDRSFVVNLENDERALEIVRSIVALADAFGLETTAEGVETEAQLTILQRLRVTFAQGFLFSKALDIAALGSLPPGAVRAADSR